MGRFRKLASTGKYVYFLEMVKGSSPFHIAYKVGIKKIKR